VDGANDDLEFTSSQRFDADRAAAGVARATGITGAGYGRRERRAARRATLRGPVLFVAIGMGVLVVISIVQLLVR
jgi:VIT1/CCC1 family predicted Fe2+/Mn2+ transporter